MDEKELIKRSAEGDLNVFEQLAEPYYKGLVNHAYLMLKNREDAYDMAQEIILKAFISIGGFDGRASFKTWIYKIATNMCLDEIRKRKRRGDALSLTVEENGELNEREIADNTNSPENIVIAKHTSQIIMSAIGELEYEYRVAIILREFEGMDYSEIAKTLGISLGTVKSRISRARGKLREKLLKYRELL